MVPEDAVAAWDDGLARLKPDGRVATELPDVLAGLRELIRQVRADKNLRLTVECLL